MSTTTKKPPAAGLGRTSNTESSASPSSSPSRTPSTRSTTPSSGHTRTRSLRTGAPVSARQAAMRRDSTALSSVEADARAEASAALEDLQQRLEKEEKRSQQFQRQNDVLQSKLDEALRESAKLEEKAHEHEEQIETLKNEKRDVTRQMREMESIYEAERSSILKEKEEMSNREEEMQTVIQRLKDSLAQRNNTADEENRPSRQTNTSPSIEGSSFAPPSSLQRSDSQNNSKLILQKDKLIESLRLELAEAQIKLVELENQGGGRVHEVEKLLMEVRMANARLMEDNESYQLLLQEKTLKGDFGQSDFSYMGSNSNQDALNALEGKEGNNGSSLADELSEATEGEGEGDRRAETELKAMKEQNKALTLYINKIIERLLQHQDFESILDTSTELKPLANTDKELPPAPADHINSQILQRAKSIASAPGRPRPRPMSVMSVPTNSDISDPDRAPSIPIGNLSRSQSTRRTRPQSDQYTGAASLVSQMYKGPDGPGSPPLRHSQTFFAPSSMAGNPNAAARIPGSSGQVPTSGNFPGMRSETSSLSDKSGEHSAHSSPPRSHSDKQTTFAGGKPRPLRLVQENSDALKDNKRATWYSGWSWGKKDDVLSPSQSSHPIPE